MSVRTLAQRMDRMFFGANPKRRFLARDYVAGDLPRPSAIKLFAEAGNGMIGEVNLVIVKRIEVGCIGLVFAVLNPFPLENDTAIEAFLRSRGVDPSTMKR